MLSLATPEAPVTFGKRVSLSGVARSLPSVRLEQRQAGTAWQPSGRSRRGPGGVVTITAKPQVPTDYRLTSGPVAAGSPTFRSLRSYASRVCLSGEAAGLRAPGLPGASVALQRFNGGSWRTIVRAPIDENGNFRGARARPGRLPGQARPGRGFVPGVSPTLSGAGMRRLALAVFVLAWPCPLRLGGSLRGRGAEGRSAGSSRSGSRRAPASGSPGSAPSPSPSAPRRWARLESRRRLGRAHTGSRRLSFTPNDPLPSASGT